MSVDGPQNAHEEREVHGVSLDGPEPLNLRLSHIEIRCQGTDAFVQSAHFVKVGFLGGGHGFQPFGFLTGGATPRVLGRQLPLPPPPPPPQGAFGQQLVAKGVTLRRAWAPKAPDAP